MIPDSLILSIIILIPFLGAVTVTAWRTLNSYTVRYAAFFFSFLASLLTILLYTDFDTNSESLQFVCKVELFPDLGISYFLGLNGISFMLLLLSSLTVLLGILFATSLLQNAHSFYALMLVIQGGLYGIWTAKNFIVWFVFLQIVFICIYGIIRFWSPNSKESASYHFFIYHTVAGLCLLFAFTLLYTGSGTFNFDELISMSQSQQLAEAFEKNITLWGVSTETVFCVAFWLLVASVFIITPMIPFHSWAAITYTEAPVSITLLLAALVNKIGIFVFAGFVLPVFTKQIQEYSVFLMTLAYVNILFCIWVGMVQQNIKRILTYISMAYLGYSILCCIIALYPETSANARLYQMENLNGGLLRIYDHTIIFSIFFYAVGFLENKYQGKLLLSEFGSLRRTTPRLAVLMMLGIFSLMGIPGLCGFVSQYFMFKGIFSFSPLFALACGVTYLLISYLMLSMLQAIFGGKGDPLHYGSFSDMTILDIFPIIPFVILMFISCFYPELTWGTLIEPFSKILLNTLPT